MAYKKEVKLKHNERLHSKVNIETGEEIILPNYQNNIPEGQSLLKYRRFHIKNDNTYKLVKLGIITHEDNSLIDMMASMAEMGTNSLQPLNDETSVLLLADYFDVPRKRVIKSLDKLRKLGVFLQIKYFSDSQKKEVEFWVLNPYISWKGILKKDSIFKHFSDTTITKLLRE
jgi:hypothetical protein